MKSIKTEIVINAPREKVWQVLTDFERYPHWSRFIKSIVRSRKNPRNLDVRLKPPGKKEMRFKPQVVLEQENVEFAWLGNIIIPGIFDGEHHFRLLDEGRNRTRLLHFERFRGVLASLFLKMISTSTEAGFAQFNHALKDEVEK